MRRVLRLLLPLLVLTAVLLGGLFAGDATGYSKKESHQGASRKAFERLGHDAMFREQVLATVSAATDDSPAPM